MNTKEEAVSLECVVLSQHNGHQYSVAVIGNPKHIIAAYKSGKLSRCKIKLAVGDKVRCEVSSYNLHIGRIVYRM